MSPLTIEKQAASQSANNLQNLKLNGSLQKLFPQLGEEALGKLLLKLVWVEVKGGQALFHEGEPGDSLYILITGRMKAILSAGTPQEREVGEISQGECVGEMALITGEFRTATIIAIRDCMLVRLSKDDFQQLLIEYPEVVLNLSKLIINRLNYTMRHTPVPAKTFTLALLPAHPGIAMQPFVSQLKEALQLQGSVKHLSVEGLPANLNPNLDNSAEVALQLHHWIAEQELDQSCLIYQADPVYSPWTQQCLRQADKIIVVTDAQLGSDLSELEKELFYTNQKQFTQSKELVILYPETTERPTLSQQMLLQREVSRHYNIRRNDARHMQRLARMITDKGIGLVLSGGGAKGFAHLGIYKALQEANIPIDMVCGTSIGAILAAAIAHEWDSATLLQKGKSAFVADKPLNDYTLPIISLLKGHKLQKINKKYFGDYHIEDLWLNYFCISGNYTLSKMVIHDRGPIWKAITASVAIPGVLPPVIEGNYLLVDGGVFNNFPVDIMKARFGGRIIGIDLLADKEYKLNYTQLPGGWYLFLSKFLPFLKRYKAPGIASIMMKATILSSTVHQRNQVPDLELFLNPPVAKFSLLDMRNYDKIVEVGYAYAKEQLQLADLKNLREQEVIAASA